MRKGSGQPTCYDQIDALVLDEILQAIRAADFELDVYALGHGAIAEDVVGGCDHARARVDPDDMVKGVVVDPVKRRETGSAAAVEHGAVASFGGGGSRSFVQVREDVLEESGRVRAAHGSQLDQRWSDTEGARAPTDGLDAA